MNRRILLVDSNHPLLVVTLHAQGFVCDEDYARPKEIVAQNAHRYDAIVIRSRFRVDAAFIDAAANLKCIARAGAGIENIDVDYAECKCIRCVHAPEANRDAGASTPWQCCWR